MPAALDLDGEAVDLPPDLQLVSQHEREGGIELLEARALLRLPLDPRMTLLVLHVTTRGPKANGRGTVEHSRVTLAIIGGRRSVSLGIRSRNLGRVLAAMGHAQERIEAAKRGHGIADRDLLRVLHVPGELLDLADETDADAETVVRAASAALLELDDEGRAELIAEARGST